MVQPWIFISHVNGDPDAEPVLQALVDEQQGLKHELGPDYQGYELFWDRQMQAATDWRERICNRLCVCAAAVILVSRTALEVGRPWVAFETFFLTTTKNGARDDLCIVPVYLDSVEPLLATSKAFDANDLRRYTPIRFPGDARSPTELVSRVAAILRSTLPKRGTTCLTGLVKVLARGLAKFPDAALVVAADRLDPNRSWSRDREVIVDYVARGFNEADEASMLQAFGDLCDESRERRYLAAKHEVAVTLAALRLQEDHAIPVAIEAALPEEAGCAHALLLSDRYPEMAPNIADLYIARAVGKQPHPWRVLDVEPVLENGRKLDLKESASRIVELSLGKEAGTDRQRQLKLAQDTIYKRRKAGRPALIRMAYPSDSDPAEAFQTIRSISPALLLLFSASPETAPKEVPPGAVLSLSGLEDHDQICAVLNTMRGIAEETTPQEEAPR